MRLIPVVLTSVLLASAGDLGVPPRAGAADYPVHQDTKAATLAAARVPVRQVEKMFSPEIARQYVVLEVAVYPKDGHSFDVDWFDFGLKTGETVAHVEKPRDVATPWPEKSSQPDKPVTVATETGVIYSRTNDPVNGRQSGWGTYTGVAVTNDPRAATPPPVPKQGPDPQMVEQRIREKSLPQGGTRSAVAGYLFFPQYNVKHRKGESSELQWSKDDDSAVLRLPEK
jgi:hypothetical protein